MDFNWEKWPNQPECSLKEREVEESFEDPFSVRLFPDAPQFSENARFFNLGRNSKGQGCFRYIERMENKFKLSMREHLWLKRNFFTNDNRRKP